MSSGGPQSDWIKKNAKSGAARNEEYYGKVFTMMMLAMMLMMSMIMGPPGMVWLMTIASRDMRLPTSFNSFRLKMTTERLM